MSDLEKLRRRNISWYETTDATAERLALDKKKSVSELLEILILEEAKHHRITPKSKITFTSMLADVFKPMLDEATERLRSEIKRDIQGESKKAKK